MLDNRSRTGARALAFALAMALYASLASFAAFAQAPASAPVIIEAGAERVQIIDGNDVREGVLIADLSLDTYVTHPSSAPQRVSMVTDRDRIDFMVGPGDTYDFAVRFRGRLYRQRITSVDPAPPAYRGAAAGAHGVDTIPFTLGPNNAIHINGSINGITDLDLIFDTGASISVLSDSGRNKGALITVGETNVVSIGGVQIGALPMLFIDYAGTLRADGVIGYDAFAGKVVEIDYDRRILRVHHDRPEVHDYSRVPITWRGSASLVPLSIETNNSRRTILAILDTGSKWSLTLNHDDPLAANASAVPLAGLRRGRNADGSGNWLNVFYLSAVEFGGARLTDVQADVVRNTSATTLPYNILGNDFLKRFNLVIDYRTSEVFVRPNSSVRAPYNPIFLGKPLLAAGVFILLVAVALLALFIRRRALRRAR